MYPFFHIFILVTEGKQESAVSVSPYEDKTSRTKEGSRTKKN